MKIKIAIIGFVLLGLVGLAHAGGYVKYYSATKTPEPGGVYPDLGAGDVGPGTHRVVNAADGPMAVYLAAIQVLLTAIEGDTTAIQTSVELIDDTVGTHGSAAPAKGVQIGGEARTSRGTAVGNGDIVRLTTNEFGEIVLANFTWLTSSARVEIINSLTEAYSGVTLCDLTNITANTAAACGYWDMSGCRHFSVQIETSGTAPTDVLTVTIECSNQSDGTAPASCAYQDLTQVLAGKASAVDTDDFWIVDTVVPFKYCRLWHTTSNTAGDDADLTAFLIKLW